MASCCSFSHLLWSGSAIIWCSAGEILKDEIENIFFFFSPYPLELAEMKKFYWEWESHEEALNLLNSSTWGNCVVKEKKIFGESSDFSTRAKWGFNVLAPATFYGNFLFALNFACCLFMKFSNRHQQKTHNFPFFIPWNSLQKHEIFSLKLSADDTLR